MGEGPYAPRYAGFDTEATDRAQRTAELSRRLAKAPGEDANREYVDEGPAEAERRRAALRAAAANASDLRDFARWYLKSRYALMTRFLADLEARPARDRERVREDFLHAVRHGERVHRARGVVTFLLALGVVATVAATVVDVLWVPDVLEGDVARATSALDRAAAIAGSFTLVLVALRLAFDRYLERIDVCASFLGMQIAARRG